MKDSTTAIFTSLSAALESRRFLATLGMEKDEMTAWIRRSHLRVLADELQGCRDEDGRFLSPQVLAAAQPYLDCLRQEPPGGWSAVIGGYWSGCSPGLVKGTGNWKRL